MIKLLSCHEYTMIGYTLISQKYSEKVKQGHQEGSIILSARERTGYNLYMI